jgi:A/G-specific adenine glycosylase
MPNISPAITPSDLTEITQSLLSWLLVSPPFANSASANVKKRKATFPKTVDVDGANPLRITKITSAGQVIHVFSHIKKTYRLQWVVLEGGLQGPPTLKQIPDDGPARVKPGGNMKAKKKKEACTADTFHRPVSMWVPLDQVAEAKCVDMNT